MNIELERVDNMDPIPGTQGTSARYSHFNMTRRCVLHLNVAFAEHLLVEVFIRAVYPSSQTWQ
jgi:hypothetical protein